MHCVLSITVHVFNFDLIRSKYRNYLVCRQTVYLRNLVGNLHTSLKILKTFLPQISLATFLINFMSFNTTLHFPFDYLLLSRYSRLCSFFTFIFLSTISDIMAKFIKEPLSNMDYEDTGSDVVSSQFLVWTLRLESSGTQAYFLSLSQPNPPGRHNNITS